MTTEAPAAAEAKPAATATVAKPKAAKPAAAPKEKVEEQPYALVSKFDSHGVTYTTLRISRPAGDKLKKGSRYGLKVGADGTITLKPEASKAKPRRR